MRASKRTSSKFRSGAFGIILKFLLRNIAEKKGRTLLIVLSVTLSSALFLSTTGMGTTMENMFTRRITQYMGGAQIIIHGDRTSPSWLHPPGRLERSGVQYEYMVPSIQFSGSARRGPNEWTEVDVRGFSLDGLRTLTSPVWIHGVPKDFRGNAVILGEHSAEHFKVEVGDPLTVLLGESRHRLYVGAVARSAGLFTDDGRTHTIILPLERLATAVAGRGRASVTYVRARRPEDVPILLEEIRHIYPRYEVREAFPREEIDRMNREMTTPFTIMSFLVFFMSVFIIYTSFRVITLERLPVIGTFRSVGATRRSTGGILLGESFLYGVAGGVPGVFLGLGILYLLVRVSAWEWLEAVGTRLVVTPGQIGATLLVAVLLSLGSAAVPIRQAARFPIKDVVLGRVRHESKKQPLRYILGPGGHRSGDLSFEEGVPVHAGAGFSGPFSGQSAGLSL